MRGMGHIVSTLLPVFAVLGIGYLLARKAFLSRSFLNELNRLVYYVALPALIIHELATAESLSLSVLRSFLIFAGATLIVAGAGFLAARSLGLRRWQYGTLIQASFRGNLAFIGIPVLIYALRDLSPDRTSAIVAEAIFIFAPTMVLYNILSVILLVGSREDGGNEGNLGRSLRNIGSNPLILAALAGIILFLLPFRLPLALTDTLEFMGRIAAPAALICVGGAMALVSMEGRYRSALVASVLKTGLTPLVVYLISMPFDLPADTRLILMVYSACPTAVASYVMSKEMYGDEAMASGTIVISTLVSMISLGVVVGLF